MTTFRGFYSTKTWSLAKGTFLATSLCSKTELLEALSRYYGGRLFPAAFEESMQEINFIDFSEVPSIIDNEIEVLSFGLHHPGGCSGYRINSSSLSVSNLLDNEYFDGQEQKLRDFVKNSDLVLWDAMYTDSEIKKKNGWGHSSIEQGLRFSEMAEIGRMALTHHCPTRTDHELLSIRNFTRMRNVFGQRMLKFLWFGSLINK